MKRAKIGFEATSLGIPSECPGACHLSKHIDQVMLTRETNLY